MLYYKEESFELHCGKMQDVLPTFKEESIDSIVCDPPYGLTSITKRFGSENAKPNQYGKDGSFARLTKGFMGKEWDGSGVEYSVETWQHCYRVLKPGGYLLAFGGTRTFHRIACAIEDAGFEIRDTIMYLYGSGFPKSLNVGIAIDKKLGNESKVIGTMDAPDLADVGAKQKALGNGHKQSFGQIENAERLQYEIKQAQNEWAGWGTSLKPAYEPIIVARKPFKGSLVDNVLKHGTGAINIDECRIGEPFEYQVKENGFGANFMDDNWQPSGKEYAKKVSGRFPSNVILTYDETDKDEVCGGMPDTSSTYKVDGQHEQDIHRENEDVLKYGYAKRIDSSSYNDKGSAARYFYCAKASKKDRDSGLIEFDQLTVNDGRKTEIDNPFQRGETLRKNTHPTVKPVELMQYLVRLVTRRGGVVLDCFMGSGSTGKAVMFENRERNANYYFIGVEMTEEYLPICKSRIEYGKYKFEYDIKQEQADSMKEYGFMQQSIFDL